jgi:hypothetical protein
MEYPLCHIYGHHFGSLFNQKNQAETLCRRLSVMMTPWIPVSLSLWAVAKPPLNSISSLCLPQFQPPGRLRPTNSGRRRRALLYVARAKTGSLETRRNNQNSTFNEKTNCHGFHAY